MICLFLLIFENSSGPLAWLYAAETVVDVALGMCYFTLWGTVLILSMVCPVLMDDEKGIGTSNVFFIFGGLSILAAAYVYLFIKETRGLTDLQKKTLFMPKKYAKVHNMTGN